MQKWMRHSIDTRQPVTVRDGPGGEGLRGDQVTNYGAALWTNHGWWREDPAEANFGRVAGVGACRLECDMAGGICRT